MKYLEIAPDPHTGCHQLISLGTSSLTPKVGLIKNKAWATLALGKYFEGTIFGYSWQRL